MLTLPTREPWYGMIARREKNEEYRADSPYYDSRFLRYENQQIKIKMRNGYGANRPSMILTVVPRRRKKGLPEWGAEKDTLYWVLKIWNVEEDVE